MSAIRIWLWAVAVIALLAVVGIGVLFAGRLTAAEDYSTLAQSTASAQVRVQVDTRRSVRAINPLIYGVSVAAPGQLAATGAQLNRWGGNPNSRYNWTLGSAWNAARDWEFRNYGGAPTAASASADAFIDTNRSLGVQSLITIPAIGWVANNGDTETHSINVPLAGGPPLTRESDAIAGYDPAANRAATSVRSVARKGAPFVDPPDPTAKVVYQDEWVNHLVHRFGRADTRGVGWYAVDNEADLWSVTHTDVHPVAPGYDDMLSGFVEYATAIKDVDPTAQVLGPALSGWTAMMYSARDRGSDNFRTHADRRAHGDVAFLPWWLDQVHQNDQRAGRRTLDAVDVHYYPQALGVYSSANDPATDVLRLRSTRSLWDPGYVDESWIAQPVTLIPRLRQWIDQYYPGTRLAINEWNWGADQTMNGALAIADVLGIFGREGVDMAAYWTSPAPGTPGSYAFGMYTNYDGQGHGFGDASVADTSSSPDDVTSYASLDSATGDLQVMLINRHADVGLPVVVNVAGGFSGTADVFRFDGSAGIQHLEPARMNQTDLTLELPASSITLVRVQPDLNRPQTTSVRTNP